ncbi:hypothetical protein MtrunA17_Chr3g0107791 [Medicago truncatula]|uniref:Uncharacterized protein n=1 Tax=Medicago truncatula TaxID=3880 RepID=A0A396IQQ4_MEDTR|nr:hypothetical protein MtrunA17_Chr3g0107791 [Medicago truncatula]
MIIPRGGANLYPGDAAEPPHPFNLLPITKCFSIMNLLENKICTISPVTVKVAHILHHVVQ